MNIYIDSEEVLCSSKMTIKESISNTSSVILNNVYPKSWEDDKDYVSNFYMPKDYSHCVITNGTATEKTYDLINNIIELNSKYIYYYDILQTYTILYDSSYKMAYMKVAPGETYNITITNGETEDYYLCEFDDLTINTSCTLLGTAEYQETTSLEITPTKKYIGITLTDDISIDAFSITTENNVIFSGVVKNSGKINLNPRYPHYATLQLLDYKAFLSEGATLNYVLDSQLISDSIKEVIKNLDGFLVGNIEIEDDTMKSYNCDKKTPYDVFEYLAEISGAIWYTETISEDLVLVHFYATDNLPQADNIEYTQDYFEENQITDISYSYSANDYRNKQIIANDGIVAEITQTQTIIYDGTDLNLEYPVASVVSITNDETEYTIGDENDKDFGINADFYYTYGSKVITDNSNLSSGIVLTIVYYPIVTTRLVAYNESEINRINESTGRNGTIERYEKRTDTNNSTELNKIAQTYLDYKGVPEVTLKVQSYSEDLFSIGQKVFFDGPLDDLTTNYLVIEKQTEMITSGNQQVLFYTYKLSSSFNDENAINFFDNQRRKQSDSFDEYITKYVDIPSSTNIIFYDLSLTNSSGLDALLDFEL